MNILTRKGSTLVGSLIAITILSTTFVSVMNLQAGIIRAKFFMQYDNTANLLASEGVEIVRAIYANNGSLSNGIYHIDYNSTSLSPSTTPCSYDITSNIITNSNQCDLDISSTGAYTLSSATTGNRIFYRFIEISNIDLTSIPKITSTVIVRNPKGGNLRVYKAIIELYNIN